MISSHMEYSDLGKESGDGKKSVIPSSFSSPQARQNTKLGYRLKFDKQERLFDDFHPEVIKNVDNPLLKNKGFQQKQRVERRIHQSEELVKYMSKLPTFLERGENFPEKAFNVGVLDWRLLEKWQHNQKEIIHGNERLKPFTRNATSISSRSEGKFQDCKADSFHPLKVQQTTVRIDPSLNQDTQNRLKEQRSKEPVLQRNPETRRLQHLQSDNIASSLKVNMEVRGETMTRREEREVKNCNNTNHHCTERNKTTVLVQKDGLQNRFSVTSHPSCLSESDDQRSVDINPNSVARESITGVCPAEVSLDASKTDSCLEDLRSKDVGTGLASATKQTVPFPGNVSISSSPSRSKNLEEKSSGPTSKSVTKNKSSLELNPKMGISGAGKERNSSPIRRISFGMGKMGRTSASSTHSGTKNFVKSSSEISSSSTCEKSNDASRSRSSPLRRLLDPFLKPKAGTSDHFANSSERNLPTTGKAHKSSTGRGESAASHFANIKLDLKGCKTIDIDNPRNEKTRSSMVQALLQVAVKNGLPFFTFAVDNNTDILAATMKQLSSRKNVNRWMYTFFSVHEMKKKNGHWINQGDKDRNHGYVSNVVAQMRVSDVSSQDSFSQRSETISSTRDFVLFSVGTRDMEHPTLDLSPSDELAAIIVKFLEKSDAKINGDLHSGVNTKDDEGKLFSTTVVLPGGDHGLPSKGEPSPLTERWKSGGLCDCGGWDVGCRIQVLANHNRSSVGCSMTEGRFELFSQEETSGTKPVFSLSPFKDGTFSVEFNSSLKLLQAFSIAIAVFSSMKPVIFSELDNLVGCKISEGTALSDDNLAKISNQEASAKYASFPPLSPFGRV